MEKAELQQDLENNNLNKLGFDLYVVGKQLNIDDLTYAFNISPTKYENNYGNEIGLQYWNYESEYVYDTDVNFQLSLFLNQFKNNIDEIVLCCSKGIEVNMGIYVVLSIRDKMPIINISRENIRLLHKLNCLLHFDIV